MQAMSSSSFSADVLMRLSVVNGGNISYSVDLVNMLMHLAKAGPCQLMFAGTYT